LKHTIKRCKGVFPSESEISGFAPLYNKSFIMYGEHLVIDKFKIEPLLPHFILTSAPL